MNLQRNGILAIAVFMTAGYLPAATQTAKIDAGLVRGAIDGNVVVYKGIPFAPPPVGDRRWKAPQHAKPWKGHLNDIRFIPQCSQLRSPLPTKQQESTSE